MSLLGSESPLTRHIHDHCADGKKNACCWYHISHVRIPPLLRNCKHEIWDSPGSRSSSPVSGVFASTSTDWVDARCTVVCGSHSTTEVR